MEIGSFRNKALERLYTEDDSRGLPAATVAKLRSMLSFLQVMGDSGQLRRFPLWNAHQLTGDRKGVWSLSVTRNWWLTFRIVEQEVVDVDFEDYH